jgi:hypothetical protein
MPFLVILMRALEVLFFLGVAGSAVVVLITLFEDLGLLFFGWTEDKPHKSNH